MIGSLIVLVIIQFIINIYFYRELRVHYNGLINHKECIEKCVSAINNIIHIDPGMYGLTKLYEYLNKERDKDDR